jgi:hypothetical protein
VLSRPLCDPRSECKTKILPGLSDHPEGGSRDLIEGF